MKVRPFEFEGSAKEDSVLYYVSNTYPGSRLPHEWLNRAVPVTPISTIDLAGKGGWTIITGIGGEGNYQGKCRIIEIQILMTAGRSILCKSFG